MRCGAVVLALVAAACGRSDSRDRADPGAAAPPPKRPAPIAASDAAPPEVVSAASPAWYDAGSPVTVAPGRTLRVAEPLRGLPAAAAPVFVARDPEPAVAIRRALDAVGGDLPRDRRVVVLVNIGGYDRIKRGRDDDGITGRITDRGFVRALLVELRRRGVRDLVVAGGASKPDREMKKVLDYTGYAAMLAELEVPYVNLNHYGDGDDRPPPWKLELPWATHLKHELVLSPELVGPDKRVFLIDVPKIKAHRFAVMTVSIKNLMSAVMIDDAGRSTAPWQRRWRMHRELSPWLKAWKKSKKDDRATYRLALARFAERLADLYGALAPDLVLAEGYPAMQGDGFARVVPLADGPVLIASTNGCYADYVAAELFGLHDSAALEAEVGFRMPPAVRACAERYFGGVDALRKVRVIGDTDWRGQPRATWFVGMAPFSLNERP